MSRLSLKLLAPFLGLVLLSISSIARAEFPPACKDALIEEQRHLIGALEALAADTRLADFFFKNSELLGNKLGRILDGTTPNGKVRGAVGAVMALEFSEAAMQIAEYQLELAEVMGDGKIAPEDATLLDERAEGLEQCTLALAAGLVVQQ